MEVNACVHDLAQGGDSPKSKSGKVLRSEALRRSARKCQPPSALQDYEVNIDVSESMKRWNPDSIPAMARSAESTTDIPKPGTRKRSLLADIEYRPPPGLRESFQSSSDETFMSMSPPPSGHRIRAMRYLHHPTVQIPIIYPNVMIASPGTAESFPSDSSTTSDDLPELNEYFPPVDVDDSSHTTPLLETAGVFDICRSISDIIQRYDDPLFEDKLDLYSGWMTGMEYGQNGQRLNLRGYQGVLEFERYRQRFLERSAHANWLRFLANALKGRDAWWHE